MKRLAIMGAETVLGVLRTLYLEPGIGSLHARQVGVFTGSAMIFAALWATGPWIGAEVTLTLVFEVSLGVAFVAGVAATDAVRLRRCQRRTDADWARVHVVCSLARRSSPSPLRWRASPCSVPALMMRGQKVRSLQLVL